MSKVIFLTYFTFIIIFCSFKTIEAAYIFESLFNYSEKSFQAEKELRLCGELLAKKKNYQDAAFFLINLYPKSNSQIKSILDDVLESLREKLGDSFNSENCSHEDLKNIIIKPFKQTTPYLPKFMPNWSYRFFRN